jgi:pimeloyl-ACP methyl ester carboxylesterase
MADDTARLIQTLGFEKAHVLGWSMGSRVALQLAIQFPEIIDHLILCSPNAGGGHQVKRKTDDYKVLTETDLPLETGLSLIFPNTPRGHKASTEFSTRLTNAIAKGIVPNDTEVSPQTIERQVRALKLWNENNRHYEEISNIHVPTLVTGGLDDVLDAPENVRIVANQIPFAWAAYFEGAGHYFISQDYKRFAELVMVFTESDKANASLKEKGRL